MKHPWIPAEPLSKPLFDAVRRRVIFDCNKWDPQFADGCVIARAPLVIRRDSWMEVSRLASALAREALAAEAEILNRPQLHRQLGLSRTVRRALRRVTRVGPASGTARLIRFDFHFTQDGWRISEANTDVPGGLNEAAGLPKVVGPHYPWASAVGDPAGAYVEAIAEGFGAGATVALVHATAYSDDQQMMAFFARRLGAAGLIPLLASPAHLRWLGRRAHLETPWWRGALDAIVRFFPGDWLPHLPRVCGWPQLFAGGMTPVSNPPAALFVQSKRFPLVWESLKTSLPTWRALLPETRDPRSVPWQTDDEWIIKPALGRAGEGVGIKSLVEPKAWRQILHGARWFPGSWVAQRRFRTAPAEVGDLPMYPCLGVFTIGDRVVGAYGRMAPRPLIDAHAQDAAVLTAA